jgi:hypothetical protein
LIENGAAAQCPDNDCGPRSVVNQGVRQWAFFRAYADGFEGYLSDKDHSDYLNGRLGRPAPTLAPASVYQKKKKKRRTQPKGNDEGPKPPATYTPLPTRTRDEIILSGVQIERFNDGDAKRIRDRILAIGNNEACLKAFKDAGLESLIDIIFENGLVIRPSTDFLNNTAQGLGLAPQTFDKAKADFRFDKSAGRPQAGTIRGFTNGIRGTADGRTQIYLDGSAFLSRANTSSFFGLDAFEDVITHELIHAGGQPSTPGMLGGLRHDLAGFEPYSKILEACK